MSDLRKAAEQYIRPGTVVDVDVETTAILVDLLRQALAKSDEVLAEREACAKVCDEQAEKDGFEGCYANACAEAIRSRGEKNGG